MHVDFERDKSRHFFDITVCHPNADSYEDLTPEQVYRLHENKKKRMYERRVLEVEQASFTSLVFTLLCLRGSRSISRRANNVRVRVRVKV